MKATGHAGLDEPFAGLFTQGMVVHETYARRRTANGSRRPRSRSKAPTTARARDARRDRRADRDRRHREDVEVEAQHRRPRRHHGDLRRRRGALVHAVGLAARARRRMDRARRAGRVALHEAAVAAGRRGRRDRQARAGRAPGRRSANQRSRVRKAAHGALAKVSDAIEKLHFNVARRPHLRVRQRAGLGDRQARSRRPISPGRCGRPPTSWCGCSTR